MSEYISAPELLDRWGIRGFELYHVLRGQHLVPFDHFGREIYNPLLKKELDILDAMKKRLLSGHLSPEETDRLRVEIKEFKENHDLFGWGWNTHDLPGDPKEENQALSTIGECLYLKSQIEAVESNEELVKKYKLKIPTKLLSKSDKAMEILAANRNLVISIGNEAIFIYEHIKKTVGVTDSSIDPEALRKTASLNCLENNEEKFMHIKEKHLQNSWIFNFNSNQSKRDFMSRLMKDVLEDKFPFCTFPAIKTYEFWKRQIDKNNRHAKKK